MTSDDEADTTDTMLSLGADDCLKKPLGEGLLKKRISKALESNRLRMWVAKLWPGRQQGDAASASPPAPSGAASSGSGTMTSTALPAPVRIGEPAITPSSSSASLAGSVSGDSVSVSDSSSSSVVSGGTIDAAAGGAVSADSIEAVIAKNPTPPLSSTMEMLSDSSLKSIGSRPTAAVPTPQGGDVGIAMSRK